MFNLGKVANKKVVYPLLIIGALGLIADDAAMRHQFNEAGKIISQTNQEGLKNYVVKGLDVELSFDVDAEDKDHKKAAEDALKTYTNNKKQLEGAKMLGEGLKAKITIKELVFNRGIFPLIRNKFNSK